MAERQFKVEALAPIGTPGAMIALLDSYNEQIEPLLPGDLSWEAFKANCRNLIIENPAILKATQISLIQSVITACELGLHIGKARGEAYVIPFKEKDGNVTRYVATLIPGYKGLVKRVYATGAVSLVEARIIYEKDEFSYELGLHPDLRHVPYIPRDAGDNRGEKIGAYCVIKMANGEFIFDVLSVADLKKIRYSSKAPNSPAYSNWGDEMDRKAAFRRTVKWANLEDAKFGWMLELANKEFDVDRSDEDAEARDRLNLSLLEGVAPEMEETQFEFVEEGDEAPDVEGDGKSPDSEETGQSEIELHRAAIEAGFEIYLGGDDVTQTDFIGAIVNPGSEMTTSIDDLNDQGMKKVAQVLNRIHTRLNANGESPGMGTMFISWALAGEKNIRTVTAIDALIPQFREELEEALKDNVNHEDPDNLFEGDPEEEPQPEPATTSAPKTSPTGEDPTLF